MANRKQRRAAAKRQREDRNSITKAQLWKAVEELKQAYGFERMQSRRVAVQLRDTQSVLAALLNRREDRTLEITEAELEALEGPTFRVVITPDPDEKTLTVELVELVIPEDDEDGEEE